MLTLSGERRKIKFYYPRLFIFACFLVIYQITSAMYQFLPPLIGIFFIEMIILNYEHEKKLTNFNHKWYLCILYMIFIEQMHGFSFLSIAIFYIIFYYFIFDWTLKAIKFRNLLLIFYVGCAYFGTFFISNLISYIYKSDYLKFGYEYVFYFIVESFLAIFFFRSRFI